MINRGNYRSWIFETEGARKSFLKCLVEACSAKGTKEFKKAVLEDLKDPDAKRIVESEAAEVREPVWERGLRAGLAALKREEEELKASAKGADWKVALARSLREGHLAPHHWIAENLHMGTPSYVQSLISRHRIGGGCKHWETLKKP